MNLRKQKRELAMAFAHEVFQGRTRSGLTQHAVADQALYLAALVPKDRERGSAARIFGGRVPDAAL